MKSPSINGCRDARSSGVSPSLSARSGAVLMRAMRSSPGLRRDHSPSRRLGSADDQALRLPPCADPLLQRQLREVDHGDLVGAAHRDEGRPAVLAKPDVGGTWPDRQALYLLVGPRVEDLGEGVLAVGHDGIAPVTRPGIGDGLFST